MFLSVRLHLNPSLRYALRLGRGHIHSSSLLALVMLTRIRYMFCDYQYGVCLSPPSGMTADSEATLDRTTFVRFDLTVLHWRRTFQALHWPGERPKITPDGSIRIKH